MMSSAVFLGYIAIVFVNIPPIVKSDHVSVNWNMLFIAGVGAICSATTLAAVVFLPIMRRMGRTPVAIIGIEAAIALLLSAALLYQSLEFFGVL